MFVSRLSYVFLAQEKQARKIIHNICEVTDFTVT